MRFKEDAGIKIKTVRIGKLIKNASKYFIKNAEVVGKQKI